MAHSGYNYEEKVTFFQELCFQVFTIFFKMEKKTKKQEAVQAGSPQCILSLLRKEPGGNLVKFHSALLELPEDRS